MSFGTEAKEYYARITREEDVREWVRCKGQQVEERGILAFVGSISISIVLGCFFYLSRPGLDISVLADCIIRIAGIFFPLAAISISLLGIATGRALKHFREWARRAYAIAVLGHILFLMLMGTCVPLIIILFVKETTDPNLPVWLYKMVFGILGPFVAVANAAEPYYLLKFLQSIRVRRVMNGSQPR